MGKGEDGDGVIAAADNESRKEEPRKLAPRSKACNNCSRDHIRCGGERPCRRCVRKGWGKWCENTVYKKRGRRRSLMKQVNEEGEMFFEKGGDPTERFIELIEMSEDDDGKKKRRASSDGDRTHTPTQLSSKYDNQKAGSIQTRANGDGKSAREEAENDEDVGFFEVPVSKDGRSLLMMDHNQMSSIEEVDSRVRESLDTLFTKFYRLQAHILGRLEGTENAKRNTELIKSAFESLKSQNAHEKKTAITMSNMLTLKGSLMELHMRELSKSFMWLETPTVVQGHFSAPLFVNRAFTELTGVSQARWMKGDMYMIDCLTNDSMAEYLVRHLRSLNSDAPMTHMKLDVANPNVPNGKIPCVVSVTYYTMDRGEEHMGQVLQFLPLDGMP